MNISQYRLDFVKICLTEIADDIEEKLRYNSLSTRLAKLEPDEFGKFMKEIEDTGDVVPMTIDHEAQMKQFLQG